MELPAGEVAIFGKHRVSGVLHEGDTIEFCEGNFDFDVGLVMFGKKGITIKGAGKDKTHLRFKNSADQDGFNLNQMTGITVQGLTIYDAPGNGLRVFRSDYVTIRDVRVGWTISDPHADSVYGPATYNPDPASWSANGAYAFYPVICHHVLIEDSISVGSSDAGVYVGQSSDILVRNTEAFHNVAGFEFENTYRAEFVDNYAHDNTGGFLVFDLPGRVQYGEKTKQMLDQQLTQLQRDALDATREGPPQRGAVLVRVVLPGAADGQLDDGRGEGCQERHRDHGQGVAAVLAVAADLGYSANPMARGLRTARTRTIEGLSGALNLVMFPMFVLSGVFFPASRYPDAVQPFVQALPLTALNDALRAVYNDALPFTAYAGELLILLAWNVVRFWSTTAAVVMSFKLLAGISGVVPLAVMMSWPRCSASSRGWTAPPSATRARRRSWARYNGCPIAGIAKPPQFWHAPMAPGSPLPPFCFCRHHAPTCTASRPAMADMGERIGRPPCCPTATSGVDRTVTAGGARSRTVGPRRRPCGTRARGAGGGGEGPRGHPRDGWHRAADATQPRAGGGAPTPVRGRG